MTKEPIYWKNEDTVQWNGTRPAVSPVIELFVPFMTCRIKIVPAKFIWEPIFPVLRTYLLLSKVHSFDDEPDVRSADCFLCLLE